MKKEKITNKKDLDKKIIKPKEKKIAVLLGRVVSAKSQKTATVLIESRKMHKLYGKSYKRSKKYLVLDEIGVQNGDIVEIMKCKPVSKNKHFKISNLLGRDIEAIIEEELKEDVKEAIAEVMPEEKIEEPPAISRQSSDEEKNENEKKPRKRKDKSDS